MQNVEKLLGATAAAVLSVGPEALANSELSKIPLSQEPGISQNISIDNSIPGSLNLSFIDEAGGRRTVRAIPSDPREDRPASPAHFKFEGIESEHSRSTSHGSTAFASEPQGNSHLKLVSTTCQRRGMSFEEYVTDLASKETTGERIKGDRLHEIERAVEKLNLPGIIEAATHRSIESCRSSSVTEQETERIYQAIRTWRDTQSGLRLRNEVETSLFWTCLVCEKTASHNNVFVGKSPTRGDLMANMDSRGLICEQAVYVWLGGLHADKITRAYDMTVKLMRDDKLPLHAVGVAFLRDSSGQARLHLLDIHNASSIRDVSHSPHPHVVDVQTYIQTVGGYRGFVKMLVDLNYLPLGPSDWPFKGPSGESIGLPATRETMERLRGMIARMPNYFDTTIDWLGLSSSNGATSGVAGGGGRYLQWGPNLPAIVVASGDEIRYVFNSSGKQAPAYLHTTHIDPGVVPHIRLYELGANGAWNPVKFLERGSWFSRVKLGEGGWMVNATIIPPGRYCIKTFFGADEQIENLDRSHPMAVQLLQVNAAKSPQQGALGGNK